VAGSCEHSNEPPGFLKGEKFLNSRGSLGFSRKTLPWS